jgi:uncharacterized repeat protein (TIGR04076 family)
MDTIDNYCRRTFLKKGFNYGLAAGSCLFFGKQTSPTFALKSIRENNSNQAYQKKEEGLSMKCKITVLRRMFNPDFAKKFCREHVTPCPAFTEGQEFIYDHSGNGNKPLNFCEHAWNDIYTTVMTLAHKGTFLGWMKEEGTNIVCCSDGIRPVVFKVERITSG